MKKTVAIILPCYNPPRGWEHNLVVRFHKLEKLLESRFALKLYVVNDGSSIHVPTGEIEFIEEHIAAFSYFHYEKNKGKGAAIRRGFEEAVADYYVFTDVDFPYELEDMAHLTQVLFDSNADVVLGTRSEHYYEQAPLVRKAISYSLKFLIKSILQLPTTDTQGGLKGFSEKGKQIVLATQINRYLFDLEMVKRAHLEKLHIVSLPVRTRPGLVFTNMGISILRRELKNFWYVFRIKK